MALEKHREARSMVYQRSDAGSMSVRSLITVRSNSAYTQIIIFTILTKHKDIRTLEMQSLPSDLYITVQNFGSVLILAPQIRHC